MSSPDNQPVEQSSEQVSAGEQDPEAVLGDLVLETESHTNAPGFVIRPDDVVSALSRLKNVAGYDHLSNVTAQEYQDRFESIYHLKKYDDPTDEVHLIVPTTAENPSSQSGNAVFRTADWHEREAYDLFGIEYEDHPDLKRILMPETWQGHPMRDDYDQNRPQVVAFREHENPLASQDEDGDTMFLNVGPHHPATHGVLHLKTVLEGEQVRDVESDIGYLHRCEEQLCEDSSYRYEIMPYPDRWDYISAGLLNEWAYARTAEDLADLDVPDYAQVLRTMGAELCRISSHLFALATFALDVNGDFTAAFMYALKEREKSQDILEALTGQRLMFNYFRLGGVAWDIPEPRGEFFEETRTFIGDLPDAIDEFHALITNNEILQIRTIDVGVLEPDVAKSYGCTGPVARGSGIDYDLRRDDPYGWYDELDWDVITEDGCDNYSRLLVRMKEVEESAKIVDQCIDLLEDWPEDERDIQSNVPRTVSPDPDREVYRAVEAAKGELGIYIRTDGTDKPGRYKIRSPCFSNLQALPEMANGDYLPDLIATLGSLDIVLGEVDR